MSGLPAVDNFGKALAKLREFAAMPVANDRDRAGVIQAFEFTFEQCWKALQRAAAAQGLVAASPRQSLQAGIQLGVIAAADEEAWLEMPRDRNMTTHLYHEEIAREIADRVVSRYVPLLENACRAIERSQGR
jgi:nucleotidyltransferase substrate binding protein (TIGR01987 family)